MRSIAAGRRAGFADDAPLLVVPDVLEALYDLARAARARSQASIVAVTGSVGKTGTKEALRLVLASAGPTHASLASYNNHWGVPLSLARMPESARYAVFEIGMNHAGEITPLTRLVRPHVAIVTTVEPVHLEYFGSVEKIADAKAEIFLGLEPGGAAVINRDNPHYDRLASAATAATVSRIVSFGEHEAADARLLEVSLQAGLLGGPRRHPRQRGDVQSGRARPPCRDQFARRARGRVARRLPILHWRRWHSPASRRRTGRGQRITLALSGGGSALLIDESYNANPASMRAALAVLGQAIVGPGGGASRCLVTCWSSALQGAALHRALVEPAPRARCRSRLLLRPADEEPLGRAFPPSAGAAMPRRLRAWSPR